jgi:membrane protease YdiL (CAAX protease family)
VAELAIGPASGVALFVVLTGGRLPPVRLPGRGRALVLRWLWLASRATLEELLWRGLVLAGLALALGPIAALALSAAGFAVWHGRSLGRRCVVHVVSGVAFGGAFLLAGLGAAVLAHGTYNLLVDWAVHAEGAGA